MIKYQGYLAGTAFALLLGAHLAMELLDAYPMNRHLWHANILFAREARPLLQHIDGLVGGNSAVTTLALGCLAGLCIAAARIRLRLVATACSHAALLMLVFLAARSYMRTFPHGLPADGELVALATKLSVVQFGVAALILFLSAVCVLSHVEFVRRGHAFPLKRPPPPTTRENAIGGWRKSGDPLAGTLRP